MVYAQYSISHTVHIQNSTHHFVLNTCDNTMPVLYMYSYLILDNVSFTSGGVHFTGILDPGVM